MRAIFAIPILAVIIWNGGHCTGGVDGIEDEVPPIIIDDVITRALTYLLSKETDENVTVRMKELFKELPESTREALENWLLYNKESDSGCAADAKQQEAKENGTGSSDHAFQPGKTANETPNTKDVKKSADSPTSNASSTCKKCPSRDAKSHPKPPKVTTSAMGLGCACNTGEPVTGASSCSGASNEDGVVESCGMAAYFHQSYKSIILFNFWRTSRPLNYFASLAIIFVLAILTVALKFMRKKLTDDFLKKHRVSEPLKHAILAALACIVTFMDFSMMLIAMTFNVGIVIVVCAAYGIAYVFFCYTLAEKDGTQEKESPVECAADCC